MEEYKYMLTGLVIGLFVVILLEMRKAERNRINWRLAEFCNWKSEIYDHATAHAIYDGYEYVRFIVPDGKFVTLNIIGDDGVRRREKLYDKVFTMRRPVGGGPGEILDEPDEELWQINA